MFLSILIPFFLTYYSVPRIIDKMRKSNLVGHDVNKLNKPEIPEMGGISIVLGFSLGASIVIAFIKYFDEFDSYPLIVSISVLCIASLIGLMDDVSILGRKEKAWLISFASLPLLISQQGKNEMDLLLVQITFYSNTLNLFYWLFIVPFGITCCANALNMSAGYNGLESGQMLIISTTLLTVSYANNVDESLLLILGSMVGSLMAFFLFNKYPAKIFVGDIGTLGFGSLIAAVVIMSNQVIYGVICIIPSFYELYATIKYKVRGIERRGACMNPIISEEGTLKSPEGAEDFTLAYFILNFNSYTEKQLVTRILSLYTFFGLIAIFIAYY